MDSLLLLYISQSHEIICKSHIITSNLELLRNSNRNVYWNPRCTSAHDILVGSRVIHPFYTFYPSSYRFSTFDLTLPNFLSSFPLPFRSRLFTPHTSHRSFPRLDLPAHASRSLEARPPSPHSPPPSFSLFLSHPSPTAVAVIVVYTCISLRRDNGARHRIHSIARTYSINYFHFASMAFPFQ